MPGSIRIHCYAALREGAIVDLTPSQAHYLGRVMRRSVGDEVLLFNGCDGEWRSRVVRIGASGSKLHVELRTRPQLPEPDIWLLAAPLRRELTELVVQKATELGVARIQPVITARTNPGRPNASRLIAIATEAAEQSERLSIPDIAEPGLLASLLQAWPDQRRLVVATERSNAPPIPVAVGPAALLVGPEGGFTEAELDALLRTPFVEPASLGPRILRAETAAIVGLALMQVQWPPAPP